MPREKRTLTFTKVEVMSALLDHWFQADKPRPTGQIRRVDVSCDADSQFVTLFVETPQGDLNEWPVCRAEVAAAPIRYCRQRAIPLPRAAKKFLETHGEGVTLTVEVDSNPPA